MDLEEFSDNSDADDVDFDPNLATVDDSEDSIEDDEKIELEERSGTKRKSKGGKARKRKKFKLGADLLDDDELNVNGHDSPDVDSLPTKIQDSSKEEIQAQEEAQEKARTDRLWEDFLNSVETDKKRKSGTYVEEIKKVTKVYNFAGQALEVEEEIKVTTKKDVPSATSADISNASSNSNEIDDADSNQNDSDETNGNDNSDSRDRSHIPRRKKICFLSSNPDEIGLGADSKGLRSVVNAIFAKKKKLNTLFKTKLDWKKYKQEHNIEEELQMHRNSKNGFVDKQEFLQRTDLREFEHERGIRAQARRKNQNQQ